MKDSLTDDEIERYSRQIALADIGYEGQLKLRNSKVCVIGLGGLGSPAVLKLTAMGVGHLRLVDRDVVSRSDLHRQYLYDERSVGYPKAEAAAERLHALNSGVELEPIANAVTSRNVHDLLKGVDVVVDGLDSIETRYLVNRATQELKIPYIFGAAIEAFGNATTIIPGETPCLECFYSGLREEDLDRCAVVGVLPSVLDVISGVQVSEAVRLLMRKEPHLKGRLLYLDLRNFSFDTLSLSRNQRCKVCGEARAEPSMEDTLVRGTCGRDGRGVFMVTPQADGIDLEEVARAVLAKGLPLLVRGKMGLTFEYGKDVKVSALSGGVIIMQVSPTSGVRNPGDALTLYRRFSGEFNLPEA